jgi:hypothetical protein
MPTIVLALLAAVVDIHMVRPALGQEPGSAPVFEEQGRASYYGGEH